MVVMVRVVMLMVVMMVVVVVMVLGQNRPGVAVVYLGQAAMVRLRGEEAAVRPLQQVQQLVQLGQGGAACACRCSPTQPRTATATHAGWSRCGLPAAVPARQSPHPP